MIHCLVRFSEPPTRRVPGRDRDDGLVVTDTLDAVSGYPAERVSEALPQIILM
jgi:hypothetical protein